MIGRRLSALLIATVVCVTTGLVAVGCGGGTTRHNTAAVPHIEIVLQAVPGYRQVTAQDLDAAVSTMRSRIRALGVTGFEIRKQEPNQIVIQLPGIHNVAQASKLIGQTGQLELYDLEGDLHYPSIDVNGNPVSHAGLFELLSPVQAQAKEGTPSAYALFTKTHTLVSGPSDTRAELFTSQHPKPLRGARVFKVPHGTVVITCGGPKSQAVICPGNADPSIVNYYLFFHRPELTGKDLNGSGVKQDFDVNGQPIVRLSFTSNGNHVFQSVTRQLYQRGQLRRAPQHFAIVLDNEIKSFPQIDYTDSTLSDGISGGGEITGIGSIGEAQNIALVLVTGALPVSFKQVESRILGSPATVAAQQWARSRKPVLQAFETAVLQYPRFLKAFKNQGNNFRLETDSSACWASTRPSPPSLAGATRFPSRRPPPSGLAGRAGHEPRRFGPCRLHRQAQSERSVRLAHA
jgi:protein-export membrane protein SecD